MGLIILIAVMVGFGWIGAVMGEAKGRKTMGMWLGALLGVIGLVIISAMKPVEA